MKQIAIYTNILTPYRKYAFDLLEKLCDDRHIQLKVFVMAETELDRNWTYEQYQSSYTQLLPSKTISKGDLHIHFNKTLKSEIKQYDPDIVICAGSYLSPGNWTILKKIKGTHYKSLFWSESHLNENKDTSSIKCIMREFVRKQYYKKPDGFLYAGKLSKQFIEKYAGENAKYFFFPNLIDEKAYDGVSNYTDEQKERIREKYGIEKKKKTFFCPARLTKVKGLEEFIDLMANCKSKDQITLLIAGDGELEQAIREKAGAKTLDVRLLGYKCQNEVVDLYAVADVFVMPSLSDPNPLSSIEALWCGLPLLVSSHVGNHPETVKQGLNGYVFQYSDRATASSYIDKIVAASDEWYQSARSISLAIAQELYSSENAANRLLDELQSSLREVWE